MVLTSVLQFKSRLAVKLTLVVCGIAVTLTVSYVFWLCIFSYRMYLSIKKPARGWEGRVHQADAKLGYRPIANSRGFHLFPIGPKVPMGFDGSGFRIPVGSGAVAIPTRAHPTILFLGCSFTYGDAISAENAFPFLVASYFHGTALNAGVCGYGYTQMLLLARDLIPQLEPDFIIFQVSPWLLSRALNAHAPSYYGDVPVPRICIDGVTNSPKIVPPSFLAIVSELPVDHYIKSHSGIADFFSFTLRVSIPLKIHDDFGELQELILKYFDSCKTINTHAEIQRYVIEQLRSLADQHKTNLRFLLLTNSPNDATQEFAEFVPGDLLINAAHDLLLPLQSRTMEEFQKTYGSWRGSPAQLVDDHPNELAHRIIAASIENSLRPAEFSGKLHQP